MWQFFQGLNKEHLQWLQAIADRAACGLIAAEGSSLFSEENATAVKKSFPDVIACLAKAQEEDDAQPLEPESPNEWAMVPAWVGLAHGLRSRAHGPKFIVFPNHGLTGYQQLVSASSTTLQAFSSKRLSNGFVPFNFDIAFVPFNRIKLQ